MKSKILYTLLAGVFCNSIAHGGTMGPVSTQMPNSFYAGGEASYTWDKNGVMRVNSDQAAQNNQGWGGRFSLGVTHRYSEKFKFNAELGGGYYGSTSYTAPLVGSTVKSQIDGYDLLAGLMYNIYDQLDLIVDVGFMVQNNRINVTENLALSKPGNLYSGTLNNISAITQVLPEIKVGGIYNLSDNWGITLAYLHVFGSDTRNIYTILATPGAISENGTSNMQNPTLNAVMFGLRYSV